MTLERAPWPVRHALGHFGAYREGVGQLVGRLRDTFDPGFAERGAGGASGGGRRAARRRRAVATRSRGPAAALDPVRPLRLLPPRLPHLPRHRRRGRQPPRADRAHAGAGAGRDRRRRRGAGAAPRRLPRLPRLRAGLPLRASPTAAGWRRRASGCSRSAGFRPWPARCSACSAARRSGVRCSPRPAAFRATGVPRRMAGAGRVGFGMGMLAASRPRRTDAMPPTVEPAGRSTPSSPPAPSRCSAAASWTPSSATSTTRPGVPSSSTATR